MKALEEGETIQANCKLPIEENIDDESGDASGRASTAFEAADKDCGEVTNEFNQCTIRLVYLMILKYLVLLYFKSLSRIHEFCPSWCRWKT